MKRLSVLVCLFFAACRLADAKLVEEWALLEVQRSLGAKRFVTFAPEIPHWRGFPDEKRDLSHDHYQIELLTNLDQLPESGAMGYRNVSKTKRRFGLSCPGVCHRAQLIFRLRVAVV